MAELKITNMVKFYTMLLLYEGPRAGYDVIKEVGNKTGKRVSPGEMYPFMKTLSKLGYIASGRVGVREKRTYSLTSSGKVFVKHMLEKFGGLIDIAIEPKLTICPHCGCKVYKGGYMEKIRGKTMSFCCRYCAQSFKDGIKK